MRIAVLGTGMVGQAIAGKLVSLGHQVTMGAREAGNEKAVAWAGTHGPGAREGSFADAAKASEIVVNATSGAHSLEALELAREGLGGKVLVDVANPLDFSGGFPPTFTVANTDSLAEQIQRGFPEARVVKALNTINCDVMVEPSRVPGRHDTFICGDDEDAKAEARALLESFGWPADSIIDLGDIAAARALEMYVALWLRLFTKLGTPAVSIAVVHAGS